MIHNYNPNNLFIDEQHVYASKIIYFIKNIFLQN